MDALSASTRALLQSHEVIQLTLESGTTLDVPKATIRLASSVLRHALESEPDVKSLKVRGSDDAWERLQLYLHPVPATTHKPMSPVLLLELIPVAHFYDIQPALGDCVSAVKSLSYSADKPLHGSAADPLDFIAMAEKLQVPELQHGAYEFISRLLREVSEGRGHTSLLRELQGEVGTCSTYVSCNCQKKCRCCEDAQSLRVRLSGVPDKLQEKLRSASRATEQSVRSLRVLKNRVQDSEGQLSPAARSAILSLIGSV